MRFIGAATLQLEIWYSLNAQHTQCVTVEVSPGTTVLAALPGHLRAMLSELCLEIAVWGKAVAGSYVVQEGDRIALTRALRLNPMAARRERFALQGSRRAGLFTHRRPGSKAGY